MIKIVFFASIREALDCASLELDIGESLSLSALIARLGEREAWRRALTAANVRVAVNQTLVQGDPQINRGDEVAFLPPVTGG